MTESQSHPHPRAFWPLMCMIMLIMGYLICDVKEKIHFHFGTDKSRFVYNEDWKQLEPDPGIVMPPLSTIQAPKKRHALLTTTTEAPQ